MIVKSWLPLGEESTISVQIVFRGSGDFVECVVFGDRAETSNLAINKQVTWRVINMMASRRKREHVKPASTRRAMSLLEVILALAILGGALTVLGQLVSAGSRCARAAREMANAQRLCDSMLAEITAGITPAETMEGVMQDENGEPWVYSIQADSSSQEGMLALLVTVRKEQAAELVPVSFSLARWMVDPQFESELEMAGEEGAGEDEQTADSSGGAEAASASGSSGGSPAPSGGSSPR